MQAVSPQTDSQSVGTAHRKEDRQTREQTDTIGFLACAQAVPPVRHIIIIIFFFSHTTDSNTKTMNKEKEKKA